RKQGIPLFAHVSDMEEVKLSVNNGAKSLMHFIGVHIDWKKDLETIDKIIKDSISWVTTVMLGKSLFYPLNKQWMKNEHWSVFGKDELEILHDSDGELENESRMILKNFVGNENISMEELLLPVLKDINQLYALGVNIVTGTDVGGKSYILPGLSVHEEMQLLQLGGMNPLDIIRSTSRNAAFMLGILDDYGTVESGKYADLVILENNPLVDISNTLSIVDVIKNGKIQVRIETNANKR
ncbi:MAG: amidohydrolase family protein, partial [Bacteroidetes bacterium]|nr:amidohydrolase family protein [Bacteroidota bacterium]